MTKQVRKKLRIYPLVMRDFSNQLLHSVGPQFKYRGSGRGYSRVLLLRCSDGGLPIYDADDGYDDISDDDDTYFMPSPVESRPN